MKTTLKQIAQITLIALLLLVVTSSYATEIKRTSLEAIETELRLENWMTNDVTIINSFNVAVETESTLQLEDWMVEDSMFNLNYVEVAESNLELESWMTGNEIWVDNTVEKEPALTLEDWMIDSNSIR